MGGTAGAIARRESIACEARGMARLAYAVGVGSEAGTTRGNARAPKHEGCTACAGQAVDREWPRASATGSVARHATVCVVSEQAIGAIGDACRLMEQRRWPRLVARCAVGRSAHACGACRIARHALSRAEHVIRVSGSELANRAAWEIARAVGRIEDAALEARRAAGCTGSIARGARPVAALAARLIHVDVRTGCTARHARTRIGKGCPRGRAAQAA